MNTNYSDEWMNTEWDEYKWLGWMNEYSIGWIQIILMNKWIQNRMNTNDSDEWMNTEWDEYKWLGWMNTELGEYKFYWWMNEYRMRWIQMILCIQTFWRYKSIVKSSG